MKYEPSYRKAPVYLVLQHDLSLRPDVSGVASVVGPEGIHAAERVDPIVVALPPAESEVSYPLRLLRKSQYDARIHANEICRCREG